MRAPVLAVLAAAMLAPHVSLAQSDAHELPPEEAKHDDKPRELQLPVSVLGGLRVGGALNAGKNAPDSGSNPNGAIGGIDLALEGGALLFHHLYAGLILGGTFFISPSGTTSNVSSFLVATEIGYLTSPQGVGGYFGLGVGYRAMLVSDALGNANKFDGVEGLATVGLHLGLGPLVHVMPRVDFGVGPSGPGNAHAIFVFGASIWLGGEVWPPKRRHGH